MCTSSFRNVDTDQIIPARFLKATTREEKFFGDNLFRDWRYNADGSLNKDFVLNNPTYSGQILVAGKNFGSGSSVNTLPGLLQDMFPRGGIQFLCRYS